MILTDTSVWVDHLRSPLAELQNRLRAAEVLTHPMVVGEIACGTFARRKEFLTCLGALPSIGALDHESVLREIEVRGLMGRGIGFIDAHLLCAVVVNRGTLLWTRDRRLGCLASELGVAFSE